MNEPTTVCVRAASCAAARVLAACSAISGAQAISLAELARLVLRLDGSERPFVHVPVPLCRAAAKLAKLVMARPPLTESAIAGLTNDADLDPTEAMTDLGYRPLGVHTGLARCFPIRTLREALPARTKKEILS